MDFFFSRGFLPANGLVLALEELLVLAVLVSVERQTPHSLRSLHPVRQIMPLLVQEYETLLILVQSSYNSRFKKDSLCGLGSLLPRKSLLLNLLCAKRESC